ncbi:glycosyltransferase [Pedococcus sp. 5OH_020]|uniref:glycosyltransferase n=1 Tax=Pedococcus sp. 5OH_020 TaxID=2989814 RepID=UPI0022E9DC00|nr:glycosyltransferase [Pedococcus sp. 5OH_020]
MTLAPPHRLTDRPGAAAPVATVTAMLVLRGSAAGLAQTLDSLARQTRTPERLLVVDAGQDGNAVELVRAHVALQHVIPDISFVTVPGSYSLGGAVRAALAQGPDAAVAPDGSSTGASDRAETQATGPGAEAPDTAHLWILSSDSAAAPTTLARLLDAVRRSPSVAVAGPKLLQWDRPGALHSVGLQLTRAGRVLPAPAQGEPDQGQYDRRSDVLAVPATGMLVERELFETLRGPDHALGEFGSELDLSWRAQQAGRRVVVEPRATMRTGASDVQGVVSLEATTRRRRQARRVALARCAWWAMPLLSLWIAMTSIVGALLLVLAKRPRAAWAELSDVGSLLTPGRVLGARWRSRGTRRVRRRDLQGLFVPSGAVLRHTGDLLHDQVPSGREGDPGSELGSLETGPVPDEVQDLNVLGSTVVSRAARNPGLLAALVMTAVAVVAERSMRGGFLDRFRSGLSGGELPGVHASAGPLWHTWLDGWHGSGLGQAGEQGPHLVVLAALAWLVEHLPVVAAPDSSVGAVIGLLVTFAMPLAAVAAYLAARVVTGSQWPRALAAVAWSTTAMLTSAVAAGRLAAVVATILLPLVAAGFALAVRRSGSATATAATVLGAAVLGAFVPALLVLLVAAALVGGVLARGTGRIRALALALGPVLLLGPWVQTLLIHPYLVFTGPGLSVWGASQALPWQLALLHPGGPASYPVLLSAPVVVAGLLGLMRSGRRGAAGTALGVAGLTGLGYAVVAPRVRLGTVPPGSPHAGADITAWAGTGLLVAALALLAAALLGADGLAVRRARGGWPAVLRWPVAAAVVVAVLGGASWTVWRTVGDALGSWQDPRPAVALDQAETGLGNRMLLLQPAGPDLTYRLLGREPGDVARVLPRTASVAPGQGVLTTAVGALFEQGAAPGELDAAGQLSDLAVGFVGLRTDPTDPRIRTLDATAGLSRLGEHHGLLFWRVTAGGARGTDDALAPSRARLVWKAEQHGLPVVGDHGQVRATVKVPPGASLVLAEPLEWARHARVTVDGAVTAPAAATTTPGGAVRQAGAEYPLPTGTHLVQVTVLPTDVAWRYVQGLILLLVVFLAVPVGTRAPRRRR